MRRRCEKKDESCIVVMEGVTSGICVFCSVLGSVGASEVASPSDCLIQFRFMVGSEGNHY